MRQLKHRRVLDSSDPLHTSFGPGHRLRAYDGQTGSNAYGFADWYRETPLYWVVWPTLGWSATPKLTSALLRAIGLQGSRRLNQPRFDSRISNSKIKSCATIPPRLCAAPGPFLGFGRPALHLPCFPAIMAAGNKKGFRRVTRSWTSQTSAHRPRAPRVYRSACF